MKKGFLAALALGAFVIVFSCIVNYLNDGFRLKRIASHFPNEAEWAVAHLNPPLLDSILSQKFYYLSKGSQCFVFESEDHQFVLKFFKFHRYRLSKITSWIVYPRFLVDLFQKQKAQKEKKRRALFKSCQIAYEELPDESQILYLHLNQTKEIGKKVQIYDRLKRPYLINIDEFAFIIQKKGTPLFPLLSQSIEEGKRQEAQRVLLAIIDLIHHRIDKGIFDNDAVPEKNAGFLEEKAFFLDLGSFSKEQKIDPYQELQLATYHLYCWLKEKDPALALFFQEALLAHE